MSIEKLGTILETFTITGRGLAVMFEFDNPRVKCTPGDVVEVRHVSRSIWYSKIKSVEFASKSGAVAYPALMLENAPERASWAGLELWITHSP